MCGRFSLVATPEEVMAYFELAATPELTPHYNIAPTQPAAVVRIAPEGARSLETLRWGLIPAWAKDPTIGSRLINARAEGIDQKPAFREAFQRRRCLVPASGFFEWKHEGRERQPYFIRPRDGGLIALAGLWERWRERREFFGAASDGAEIETFTIVTTDANELVRPLHDRMPLALRHEDFARWLDPNVNEPAHLNDLLHPTPSEDWTLYRVAPVVNSAANDSPLCIEPI